MALTIAAPASAATFTVSTNADSGAGSKLKGKPGKGAKYKFSVRATDLNGNVSVPSKASFEVIKKAQG